MKNLLLLLTLITFTFSSCSSSDDDNNNNNNPVVTPCEAPINLSASEFTEISAVLNWVNSNDVLNVTVEYGLTGFTLGTGTVVSTSQNSIGIEGLNPDTSYDFYVQAKCAADNNSPQSNVASFTTDEMIACLTPTNITASEIKATSADLNWDNPNANLDVEVEYGLAGFTLGSGIVVSASQNSISIEGLTSETSYDFYVQAICAANNMSPQSQVTSFTTTVASPFAGTWSGTYIGDDTGTWIVVYSENGEFVSGSAFSNNANQTVAQVSGTLTADGATTTLYANGVTGTSQITGDTITGTWVNPGNGASGTSSGSRE